MTVRGAVACGAYVRKAGHADELVVATGWLAMALAGSGRQSP
jgi:hypothetical protein